MRRDGTWEIIRGIYSFGRVTLTPSARRTGEPMWAACKRELVLVSGAAGAVGPAFPSTLLRLVGGKLGLKLDRTCST